MKVYEAVFKEGLTQGMFALGLVYDPAMQDFFVAFNNEEDSVVELSTVNEEKRMLLGAILIPNKDILRVDKEGNQFSMRFSEDTIEKIGHNWIQKAEHKNFTKEHSEKLENISVVEMWTVSDPEKDKSNFYGKTYPKGTLVAMTKVNDDKTWEDVKNGTIKGYSIEAVLGLKNIEFSNELNTNIEMTELQKITDAIKDGFKAFFNSQEVEQVEVVAEVTDEVTEPTEELNVEALKDALTETLAQFSVTVDEKIENLKVEFSKQLEDKNKEVEDLKVELSKQPEVEIVKRRPEVVNVELSAKGRILEQLRNNK